MVFFQFRQQIETIQGVLVSTTKEDDPHQVSKQMITYAKSITVSRSKFRLTVARIPCRRRGCH